MTLHRLVIELQAYLTNNPDDADKQVLNDRGYPIGIINGLNKAYIELLVED